MKVKGSHEKQEKEIGMFVCLEKKRDGGRET